MSTARPPENKPPIKAKFIGKSTCGFVQGTEYYIRTMVTEVVKQGKHIAFPQPCLCVYDAHSFRWCPYSRLETFLENWEILK